MATAVLDPVSSSLLESLDSFPDRVCLLKSTDGRYGCYYYDPLAVEGLACFSNAAAAFAWVTASIPNAAMFTAEEVTFDEAREVALGRPADLRALFLLDDPASPRTHWLK